MTVITCNARLSAALAACFIAFWVPTPYEDAYWATQPNSVDMHPHRHPDKNPDSREDATSMFRKVQSNRIRNKMFPKRKCRQDAALKTWALHAAALS